ncbi:hypothetical protein P3S67_016177 [Capsicum chacoense]
MILDAAGPNFSHGSSWQSYSNSEPESSHPFQHSMEEDPNPVSKKFYDLLHLVNFLASQECPSNPKHKIDVYLQPLIKELTLLWETGVEAFGISKRQNFQLRAALIWTISDFPAYSTLSGWSTAGKLACPYCIEETQPFRLQHGRKQSWFDCHRMILDHHHPFRRDQKNFLKGQTVRRPPPTNRTGEEILDQICNLGIINVTELDAEQEVNKIICKIWGWKKRSIFWDLP